MGFLEDLFGRLSPQRPPVDVFGGVQPLDAFGDLMGDGSDALQPITPFGGLDRSFGGFSGGLGSTTSSSPAFWQMPALGGGIGTNRQGAFSSPLPLKSDPISLPSRRAFSTKPPAATTTSTTPTAGTRPSVLRWLPQAQAKAQQYGVPVEMVLAIINNESGGDPNAQSADNPGQGSAKGLMQVMPFHFQPGENPFDPDTNLDKGVKYLASVYKQFGNDPDRAMAAYFGGPSAVRPDGSIATERGDVNITIGKYLSERWRPALAAYRQYLQGQTAAPQTFTTGGQWDHLVPGGQGRVETGGTHGGHPAIDIFAKAGTPIRSPVDGVSSPGQYPLGGNASTLKGSDGRWYYFAHAQAPMLGGAVRKGDIIGYVGNTGNARGTASHLHYAVASNPSFFDVWNGSGDVDPT
jgi:murein DD-endopeptidase MepM/ murein hydrolase activator NlpD